MNKRHAILAIVLVAAIPTAADAQTNTERLITIDGNTRNTLAAVEDMPAALEAVAAEIAQAMTQTVDGLAAQLQDIVDTLAAVAESVADIEAAIRDMDVRSGNTHDAVVAQGAAAADRHAETLAAISGVGAADINAIERRLDNIDRTIAAQGAKLDALQYTQLAILIRLQNNTAPAPAPQHTTEPEAVRQVPALPKQRSTNLVQHEHRMDITYHQVITAQTISHGDLWGDTQYRAVVSMTCDTDTYLDSADAAPLPGHRAWGADPATTRHAEYVKDHIGNFLHNNKFPTGNGGFVVYDRAHEYNGILLAADQELQFEIVLTRNGGIDKPERAAVENQRDITSITVQHKSFYTDTKCTWSGQSQAAPTVPADAPTKTALMGITKPDGSTIGPYAITLTCGQPADIVGITGTIVDDDNFATFTTVDMVVGGELVATYGFDSNGDLALRTGELPTDIREMVIRGDTYNSVLATIQYRSTGLCSAS